MSQPALSVVIMAYDEARSVVDVTHELHAELVALGVPFELLLVDDGSSDGTGEAVDALAAALSSTRAIHHRGNLGLGGVYRTGFAEARGDALTFFPADGQFAASLLPRFFTRIQDHDLVLGTLPRRAGTLGKLLSWIERVLYRALIGPMPEFQGIFMIRRALLQATPLRSTGRGWAIVMELIFRVSSPGRHRVVNFAMQLRPRQFGRSKANTWRNILANLRQLLRLRRILGEGEGR